jgi:hypothetical protein
MAALALPSRVLLPLIVELIKQIQRSELSLAFWLYALCLRTAWTSGVWSIRIWCTPFTRIAY